MDLLRLMELVIELLKLIKDGIEENKAIEEVVNKHSVS